MNRDQLITRLPYDEPFLFADHIEEVSEEHIVGSYTFPEDSYFYKGHFVNHPVTPGVILTECMAQIGLVCLGIYLLAEKGHDLQSNAKVAMTENHVLFKKPVYPGEKVTVHSQKQYFRMHKLKCKVKMLNSAGEEVCSGVLSGILIPDDGN
ncbi:3-hydroxyacyl-ACP dehydratase FabZ family protein [Flavimarina sp. Hel_I_48]|uniref:3-hydroxyacyl-ACP dehydratase FabZ family protein n=1 Tax=Flavimarina sp. Hel_I_48 TaxID=1392488 RepID=UPI0004DF6091|nr:3-hydroxyacyl-ACP dehydratase FabZ family protein [Flavimarina sp. Hel_I_48]